MAKFLFKLQGVLRQRKHIEQQKQRELAQKQRAVVELQQQFNQLQETVQSAMLDLRQNRLTGQLDMNFLAAHRRYMMASQRQAVTLAQKITLAQRVVDDARAELAEAAKQRKIIEKLRERQFERWREQQNQREQAAMDEIGMQLAYQNLTDDPESGFGSLSRGSA